MGETAKNGHIRHIPLEELRPGPWQPRRAFDDASITELAISIKENGVLTPLRVVPPKTGSGYLIVAGERRWRAAGRAGLIDLPCIVMDAAIDDRILREVAITDNLHRANLRPGEEARSVLSLIDLGATQREVAQHLGKSPAWISQRLAIAKLPDAVMAQLDTGNITRDEALALTKLLAYPDMLAACLEPDGTCLKARLARHVPEGITDRVQAVIRFIEMERQREAWVNKMRRHGHQVLDEAPRDSDRRYVRILPGSETARRHQEARLSCEAWAWSDGYPVRYCTDPPALQTALSKLDRSTPADKARQEQLQRTLDREAARDSVMKAWLATSRGLDFSDLAMLGRQRIRVLTSENERLLARVGMWLGCEGDRESCISYAKTELSTANHRKLVQLWFLTEIAQAVSYAVIPDWLESWLAMLGLADTYLSAQAEQDKEAASFEAVRG